MITCDELEAFEKSIMEETRLNITVGREFLLELVELAKLSNLVCAIPQYSAWFGDDKICECGHVYYRHFDTYEDMSPIGCKYCPCRVFKEQKEMKPYHVSFYYAATGEAEMSYSSTVNARSEDEAIERFHDEKMTDTCHDKLWRELPDSDKAWIMSGITIREEANG